MFQLKTECGSQFTNKLEGMFKVRFLLTGLSCALLSCYDLHIYFRHPFLVDSFWVVWLSYGREDQFLILVLLPRLKDIELSREINESFRQSAQARLKLPSGIEMNVHVLTTGYYFLTFL